ncbi:uncharacterized protein B0H18DRAFT_1001926 [Fomitopsis serialis]|uniref:uncharacterized protein n=1 Tax=Fomitopsis serialis TaxID=139415 RepID=UPI0020076B8D|nr:uncharacterized protein B0H18DRAFT_1001926 [Neoantrodia serialis]KAH9927728.1 hypothetical protein B0H18DRAFT_1001926 [Neoantrodia serialis]
MMQGYVRAGGQARAARRADEPPSEQVKAKMGERTGGRETIETTVVVESEVERMRESKAGREREAERVSMQEGGRLKAQVCERGKASEITGPIGRVGQRESDARASTGGGVTDGRQAGEHARGQMGGQAGW